MQVLVWMLLQAWQAAASPLLLSCKTIEVLQAWKGGRHVGPGWLLLLLLQQCCPWLHLRTITLHSTAAKHAVSTSSSVVYRYCWQCEYRRVFVHTAAIKTLRVPRRYHTAKMLQAHILQVSMHFHDLQAAALHAVPI
jgi:hypothetical protein